MHHTDWLSDVKAILPSRNKLHLVMNICLFICDCFIPFPNVSPRVFTSRLMRDPGSTDFFLEISFSGFHIRWMLASAYVRKYSSYLNSLKSLRRTGIISSLNVWWRCLRKPWGPRVLPVGKFLTINPISFIYVQLIRLSTSFSVNFHCLILGRCPSISCKWQNLYAYSVRI